MATRRDEDVGDEGVMSKGEGRVGVEVSNLKRKLQKANRERCCSSLSKNYEAAASTSPLTRQPQCFLVIESEPRGGTSALLESEVPVRAREQCTSAAVNRGELKIVLPVYWSTYSVTMR